jgi:hypothetical protein
MFTPEFTVAVMLALNAWVRSEVLGLGLVALVVAVVAVLTAHVRVTGFVPVVEHCAKAPSDPIKRIARMPTASAARVMVGK